MADEPNFGRFKKAVRHGEPDRVPLGEILVEYPVQSKFLGTEITSSDLRSQVDFWAQAGYDYVPLTVGLMTPGKVTQESSITKVIREVVLKDSPEADNEKKWNLEYSSFITTREDFEKFPWDILGRLDLTGFDEVQKFLPPKMKVIALSGKIFTLTWMLMGFNHFAMSLVMDEKLVADVVEKISEIQLRGLQKIFAMPHVGGVWVVDDIAFGNGPMISPQALRDHFFPPYKKIAAECHANDMLFLMHSDGNMGPIIEDLIDLGLDALHPVDPTCMDIFKVKEMYGDRLCLIGNVSNELLRNGTPRVIEQRVKELIEKVAPGGGFCLGSGNSVTTWSTYENYLAMRNATLAYGKYPIRKA
jgi:uroporphyrinogen decarboxylase